MMQLLNGIWYNEGWKNRCDIFLIVMIWDKVQDNWIMFMIMTCNMEEVVDNLLRLDTEETLSKFW
jgi:hypothetical protein